MLGPVFLARDADRRSLAIKVFRLDITPEQAAELASQLSALSRVNLEHPSIAAPIAAGVEGTVAYLVQEYVGADSLDAAIRQYGPAPLGHALKIFTNVGAAIDFAAAVNVHHGALHPRDLLVTPEQVRMTGLGVAAALETIGLRAPIRRPYTAPERIQREAWNGRADVYSLGVLAGEMILGRGRPDESRVPEPVAVRVQDVIARATAARASERFATALDLVRGLQDAVTSAEAGSAKAAAGRSLRAQRGRGLLLPLDEEPAAPAAPAGAAAPPDARPTPEPVPEPVARIPEIDVEPSRMGEDSISDLPLNRAADTAEIEQPEVDQSPAIRRAGTDADPYAAGANLSVGPDHEVIAPVDDARFTDVLENEQPVALAHPEVEREVPSAAPLAAAEPTLRDDVRERPQRPPAPSFAHEAPVVHRTGALPFVAVLVIGLVVGAIAGYYWGGSRNPPINAPAANSQQGAAPATPSTPLQGSQPSAPPTQPPATPPVSSAATKPGGQPTASRPSANPPATKPAPAQAAPAAANVKGRLVVKSTPSGATVTVNGRWRGVTPLRVSNLSAGRYTVRLTRSGYTAEEREVVISSDRPSSTLTMTLKRGASAEPAARTTAYVGSVGVDSTPPGAKVFLDGKLVGTTPCVVPDVAAGSHVVRIDLIGFRRWAQSVEVKSGGRVRVTAALERESQ